MADTRTYDEAPPRAPAGVPERVLARVPRASRDGLAVARRGCVEWANDALGALLGVEPALLEGTALTRIDARGLAADAPPVDLARLCGEGPSAVVTIGEGGRAVSVEATPLDGGEDDQWVLTFRGISQQVRADEDLRASERRFRALAAHAPIGVFHSDHGLRLDYVNPRFAELWGQTADELHGTGWLDRIHPADRDRVVAGVAGTLTGETATFGFRLRPSQGDDVVLLEARVVPVERGDHSIGFVGTIEDVTAARRHEEQLSWQATHDPLTGLANRTELWNAVEAAIAERDRPIALLFFDIDNFKLVNDSLGHAAGDELLRGAAERIARALRGGDLVARFGGDEFVVLCRNVDGEQAATVVAERLLDRIAEPIEIGARTVRVTASVGVVLSSHGDADALIRDADIALYQAKAAGKARAAVFDEEERHRVQQHLDVVSDLRRALGAGSVDLHYQPLVSLATGAVVGAEALLRYHHPVLGQVSPLEVVRLAESSGHLVQLGDVVLDVAIGQLAAWHRERGAAAPGHVAVNIAAAQLVEGDIVGHVEQALAAAGLRPDQLCLELTEGQLMADTRAATRVLGRLHDLGIRIAIDDFGTGYSSLSYLRQFPVDIVKLDRSFVADLGHDPAAAAIVTAVVSLAGALDMSVVAEGVETAEQLAVVTELGCHLVQGYGVGHPVTGQAFPEAVVLP